MLSHGRPEQHPDAPQVQVPPLMSQERVTDEPLNVACARARAGCDAGLITWRIGADELQAAIVFAPDIPLGEAMTMLPLCAVSLQNALGTLSPPEVAVHLGWDGSIAVNGARCGALSARASQSDPATIPDWLIIGLRLTLLPAGMETGLTPDQTDLFSEGCGDIAPQDLISAWARHSLHWINRWQDEGRRALHEMWTGLAIDLNAGIDQSGMRGCFTGVDEHFGMLLREETGEMRLIPLTSLLEDER